MDSLVAPPLEDYARSHCSPLPAQFGALEEETRRGQSMWQMQVGPIEGAFLRFLAGLIQAKRVIELGTFTGYSALAMALALPDDGLVVTCDVDPDVTAIARRHWKAAGQDHKIELRLGPGLDTLRSLGSPHFDMAFIDADKENYSAYFDECMRLVRPGGLIVADNTLWSGRVLAPRESSDRAIVAFNAKVHADPRVENVLLTVRDGMMVMRRLA